MTFERTRDWELIKSIVTHPKIYPYIGDDFSPPAADWQPFQSDNVWYVLVKDGSEVLGLWIFIADRSVCWSVHTCLLPNAWGERGATAVRELPEWVWANTPCKRVITEVPAYNRMALRFAKRAGMVEFGLNPKAYEKDGKLHDIHLLGMSRPGV